MNPKLYIILIVLSGIVCSSINAQSNTFPSTGSVGVGTTTPDASSLLEIKSTKKGMLIPRMSKNQRDAIATPVTGLLIYQLNSTPGFYYYDGGAWKPVAGGTTGGWSLTGNAGTDSTKNFIGTTDLHPLVLKVNNTRAGFIGYGTLSNTSFGYQALSANTTGNSNTGMGYQALHANTTGSPNTAVGYQALYSNTTGNENTAIGAITLYYNTIGYNNTALGRGALYQNTEGADNTATGFKSLFSNISGYYNTANGSQALEFNISGMRNTANGAFALDFNTGDYNTANGALALYNNTTGAYNTANGDDGMYYNSTGNFNTAVGSSALLTNNTGSNNAAIGYDADVNSGSLTNATALGSLAYVNASNKVRIGDVNVTVVESQAGSWTTSDGRFKNNIKENVKGLEFIKLLRPVTYNFDTRKFSEFLMQNYPDSIKQKRLAAMDKEATAKASGIIQSGFIAQEVEEAVKRSGYNFNGVHMPDNPTDNWSLSYEKLTVPLVKAVQELSKMNDEKDSAIQQQNIKIDVLQQQLNNQQNQINELKAMIVASQSPVNSQQSTVISSASIQQNIPNPFTNTTSIGYTLPQKFLSAQIIITDKNGKALKTINISGSGRGSINVDASTLSSGAYQYSLVVDGKLIDTKQMVLVK